MPEINMIIISFIEKYILFMPEKRKIISIFALQYTVGKWKTL